MCHHRTRKIKVWHPASRKLNHTNKTNDSDTSTFPKIKISTVNHVGNIKVIYEQIKKYTQKHVYAHYRSWFYTTDKSCNHRSAADFWLNCSFSSRDDWWCCWSISMWDWSLSVASFAANSSEKKTLHRNRMTTKYTTIP